MFELMKKRTEQADEQRRVSEAKRLRNLNISCDGQRLQRTPLPKNVTLTIEIPNVEHATMISRMEAWADGDSIPQIMNDTGVLVQFPDLVPEIKNARDFVNKVQNKY
ncbi:unnamed protein product [Gongylonema pulchrum]|uniref:PilZ domain-containing protein n=1 Tax=Gongylonema pulchrum TaxID=637853 RepID=A0A183DII8_9BILA|nr:unnamed protein product [Gongylonema pulchrum]